MTRAFVVIAFAGFGSLLHPSFAQAGKWQAMEQIAGQTPVTVNVGDKPRAYFRVTPTRPLSVVVVGPARVQVVSRAEIPRGAKLATYHMAVTERGAILEESQTETGASEQTTAAGSVVGKGRKLGFDVPPGRHNLRVEMEGVASVLVRLRVAGPQSSEDMISLTPFEATRSVVVAEGEKLISYYSALPGKPVKVRVVGPTRLELLTRLDFDSTMRGTQRYKLVLTVDGRPLRTEMLSTTKATTATRKRQMGGHP